MFTPSPTRNSAPAPAWRRTGEKAQLIWKSSPISMVPRFSTTGRPRVRARMPTRLHRRREKRRAVGNDLLDDLADGEILVARERRACTLDQRLRHAALFVSSPRI